MSRWGWALVWEPRDLWIGVYWTRHEKSSPPGYDPDLSIYVCIIPCLPIRFERF